MHLFCVRAFEVRLCAFEVRLCASFHFLNAFVCVLCLDFVHCVLVSVSVCFFMFFGACFVALLVYVGGLHFPCEFLPFQSNVSLTTE